MNLNPIYKDDLEIIGDALEEFQEWLEYEADLEEGDPWATEGGPYAI